MRGEGVRSATELGPRGARGEDYQARPSKGARAGGLDLRLVCKHVYLHQGDG